MEWKMIVAAVDLSPESLRAARWAHTLASRIGTSLKIVYVVQNEYLRMPGIDAVLEDETRRRRLMRDINAQLDEGLNGADYTLELREGGVAREVKAAAKGAQLVVVGVAPDAFTRFSLGTLADRLSHEPPAPLAVIAEEHELPENPHWLVGIDFSPGSTSVLTRTIDLAKSYGAKVTLTHVVAGPVPTAISDAAIASLEAEYFPMAQAHKWAREKMDALVDEYKELLSDVEFETRIVEGYPVLSFEQACQDMGADAIVVGASGRSGIAEFFLGSVARGLLRRMPANVIVMPA